MGESISKAWTVGPALRADCDAIAAGNCAIAWETETLRLSPDVVGAGVRAVFDDPGRGFYLVARDAEGVVGQLMVTFEWSDWRAAWWYWIQSVYVAPRARRTGVYRALHEAVVVRARTAEQPVAGVRLYVEHDNTSAQATYGAVGMSPSVYRVFEQAFEKDDLSKP